MKHAAWVTAVLIGLASTGAVASETVKVTLKDDQILLDKAFAKAGSVEFVVSNEGTVLHELVVLKSDVPEDQLPMNKRGDKVIEGKASIGEIEAIPVGQSRAQHFTMAAGNYDLICNKVGHYKMGMHTAFVVN